MNIPDLIGWPNTNNVSNIGWPDSSNNKNLEQLSWPSRFFKSLPRGNYNYLNGFGLINAAAAAGLLLNKEVPDVPNLGGLKWFIDMVKAPEVWAQGYTGQDIVVAIIDTGVEITHTGLQGKIWTNLKELPGNNIDDDLNGYIDDVYGWDFVDSDNNPTDLHSHGTHVAGIVTQIAPNVKIMAVRVANATGFASDTNILKGIVYAVNNGANIVNISLGGSNPTNSITNVIKYGIRLGISMVTMAAGNSGRAAPGYPAAAAVQGSNIGLSVGAVTNTRTRASFSDKSGGFYDHVMAPGSNINSTILNNRYGGKSGTSMSAPVAAGVAALLLSINRNLSIKEMIETLTNTAIYMPY